MRILHVPPSFDRFGGTSGDKIDMFENQRWRIQYGRQKGNIILYQPHR